MDDDVTLDSCRQTLVEMEFNDDKCERGGTVGTMTGDAYEEDFTLLLSFSN